MYDSKKLKEDIPVTLDYILSRVSEYDIYARYLGQFKVGYIYNSPFRKDKNPSFGIFLSKRSGKLLFKDHGNGICGDVIKFVSELKGLTNYNDILNTIIKDLKIKNDTVLTSTYDYKSTSSTVIGVVRQPFTEVNLEYWAKYGITVPTLDKYKVNSIKYYLCNGIVKGIYKLENPMFSYKVFNNFKIYRPFGDKFTKWRNNLTSYDIQGFEQLPKKGNLLIITKSLKDVMALYEIGYTAISPSSESTFIPDDALEALKLRFKRILLCFDRDVAGVRNMRKVSLKTGLNGFLVHKSFNAKDISDAIAQHGQCKVKEWLNKTI